METATLSSTSTEIKQKYLGKKGFLVFITLISAFIPLSTDIYLPALPVMADGLHASAGVVNLTLIFFFVFYAIGTIFWGPLSDKYGRRRILMTGLCIYTIASLLCIVSGNVYELILFRIFQAIGCGAATATGTAIVKDSYSGRKLLTVLALVQSMAMLSPIVSPVIGAVILSVFSWRGVFGVLSVLGVVTFAGSVAMQETIAQRSPGSVFHAVGKLGGAFKNKNFMTLLITFMIMAIPSMSFISASSFIFVDGFGLSERAYSYYFAANAVFFLIGPLSYIKLSKHFPRFPYITAAYSMMSLCGLFMALFGTKSPLWFMLPLIPASFFGSLIRPKTTHLMLDQVTQDTGAASSVMNCANTLFGCVGMLLISSGAANRIVLMGVMYLITSAVSLTLWSVFSKKVAAASEF
jgi:MFS transporter, DHA1 family, multidrug resistance protein